MKKIYFLLLLFAGSGAFAQDYLPLPQVGMRRYFTNAAGYLRGIRVDSVVQEVGYKRHVTFKTARGWKSSSELADSNGACWVGKDVRAYPDGDWQFPNVEGDTILVKTGAQVGDTWVFHRDTSALWTEAKLLSADTQTVFGVLDSVKKIQLTLKSGSTALPQNPISAFQIVLSKTMGFTQVPDLHLFPYKDLDSSYNKRDFWYRKLKLSSSTMNVFELLLFSHVHNWNPPQREMYNFQIGDVLYGRNYRNSLPSRGVFIDTVVARQDFADFTAYTYNSWSWKYGTFPNESVLTIKREVRTDQKSGNLQFDTLFMPEEFGSSVYKHTYIDFNDTSFCSNSLLVEQLSTGERAVFVGLGPPREEFKFKKGMGQVYYEYIDGDGQRGNDDLYSYLKNGVPCGFISSVPSGIQSASSFPVGYTLYPQPATTEVFINAPRLRYPATVSIQNLQGQLLSKQLLLSAGKGVFVGDLPAGMYLFSLVDGGGKSTVHKLLVGSN